MSRSARMPRIVIVGAGFGGVAVAGLLRRAGFTDLLVLEKADGVGGVWRDNAYPGCACDVPAPLYSYSFAQNPSWSRRFPPYSEIRAYLQRCVTDFGLDDHIRLNTELVAAYWDDDASYWRLRCADGTALHADVLISAVGQLSRPLVPSLPGADTFAGRALHTTGWDANLDVTGLRVGVIGTGASTIQLVPAIAGRAKHVTVFQRTPPWTLPKPDRRYGRVRHTLWRRIPVSMQLSRAGTWAMTVVTGLAITGNPAAHALIRTVSRAQLRWQVHDRALRAKLAPGYPMGCKRVLYTNTWLPALQRPDVDLVTEPIAQITKTGVQTVDGVEHACDMLVYGTGFRATEFLTPLQINGARGVRLEDVWRDGAHAYLGMAVAGFPNMFLIYGPNTNTGNTSVIYFHEAQARYILQAVRVIADSGAVEVHPEVASVFDDELRSRLSGSVWAGCESWYRTSSGRVVTNWPGMAGEYRRRTAQFDRRDYRVMARGQHSGVGQTHG